MTSVRSILFLTLFSRLRLSYSPLTSKTTPTQLEDQQTIIILVYQTLYRRFLYYSFQILAGLTFIYSFCFFKTAFVH